MERVADFLMDLLREGSAGTVMKYMMGFLQVAPSSRGERVLKDLRDTQWHGYGPWLRRISVSYSPRELLFCHFLREVAFSFRTLSWVFQAQATIRKWPGRVLLDGLGAIPGSPVEVEGGFAVA